MPILNMIAQGGSGGGGSNVGEPTNLSATVTSNSSIDIVWTDNGLQTLPPSTFQKSVLVRKVGSAPTTPSDGTTVVTETVMNTYQSSAYSDTGLTEGTTYYYQVFSYSTDGGITYGIPVSATPQGGWQPGLNTLVYYNINYNDTSSTIYDLSGNNYNQTWHGTASYSADATYGKVAEFPGSASTYTQAGSQIIFGQDVTLIALIKATGISIGTQSIFIQGASGSTRPFGITIDDGGAGKYNAWYRGTTEVRVDSASNYTPNAWKMIATTRASDGTVKIYIDGNLDNTGTATGTISYTGGENAYLGLWRSGSYPFEGQFKLLIGENRVWTADEIKNLAIEYGFNPS